MKYRPTKQQVSEADLTIIEEWLKQIRTSPVKRKDREQEPPAQQPQGC